MRRSFRHPRQEHLELAGDLLPATPQDFDRLAPLLFARAHLRDALLQFTALLQELVALGHQALRLLGALFGVHAVLLGQAARAGELALELAAAAFEVRMAAPESLQSLA